jgi:hypothetical protein
LLTYTCNVQTGIFIPRAKAIKDLYSNGLVYGAGVTIWKKNIGVLTELEYFRKKSAQSVYALEQGVLIEKVYDESLTLIPVWISVLARSWSSKAYVFYGLGTGITSITKKIMLQGSILEEIKSGSFPGFQVLLGIGSDYAGVTIKYSLVKSNNTFDKADFGGFTGTINIFF